MKKLGALFAVILMFAASGCATTAQQPLLKQTPSGFPEAEFPGYSLETVQGRIASRCSSGGSLLEIVNSNTIKCSKDITETSAGMFYTALAVPRNATNPRLTVMFTGFPNGNGVKVNTNVFIEYQTAFGQINRNEYRSTGGFNTIQQMLFDIGGK